MKDKRGQALVEFVVILPVLIMIIMAMVDFGNIISSKYELENDLSTIVDLYHRGEDMKDYLLDRNEQMTTIDEDKYVKITLSKSVTVVTPVLNNVLGKNHKVSVSRSVVKEVLK